MRIIKPSWGVHLDENDRPKTIYSIDIHPDRTRLATGGIDSKIKIWSTEPILDQQKEQDEAVPKLLSTLTAHEGAVMSVRWNASGTLLASGADDKVVLIWALDQGRGGKVWGSTETNVENWKAVKPLRNHDSDVAGVAWSPGDDYLASVGLDSTVYVYDANNFNVIRRLDGHMGFVKGLVWDPAGQYLATQSDDNSLKVWNTEDWSLATSVEGPFVDAPKAATLRPSWSPEGTHIATPNSMSGKVFVAGVVERGTWKCDISMVGHEDMVTTTAFNPLLFLRDGTKPVSTLNMSSVIALASRNEISFWSTSQSQPFLVLNDVFDRDVLDLSWSKDGLQLWACSSEGHIAALVFSLDEFPPLAPPGSKENHHATFGFKKRINLAPVGTTPLSAMFGTQAGATMDKPNVLVARKGPGAKRPRAQLTNQMASGIQGGQTGGMSAFQAAAAQAPLLPAAAAYQAYQAQPSTSATGFANLLNHPQQAPIMVAPAQVGLGQADGPYYHNPTRLSQAEYRLVGPALGAGREMGPQKDRCTIRPSYLPKEREPAFELSHSHDRPGGSRALAVPAVQTYGSVQLEDGPNQDTFEYRNFGAGARPAEVGVVADGKSLWVDYLNSHVVLAAGSPVFSAVSTEDNSLVVYSPTGRRLFPNIVLDSPCAFLVAEDKYLMAITARGSLTVYDVKKVAALVPPHSLSTLLQSAATESVSNPSVASAGLQPNGIPVLALDSGASFAFHHALGSWSRLSELWWCENSDAWEPVSAGEGASGRGAVRTIEAAIDGTAVKGKHKANSNGNSTGAEDLIIVDGEEAGERLAKRQRVDLIGEEKAPLGKEDTFRFAVTLAHLETRLHAAELLKSSAEYKAYLMAYARKLAEEGLKSKATELVNDLLGPKYFHPGKQQAWEPEVCGIRKRDLLADVIEIFGDSKELSELGKEYRDVLDQIASG